MKNKEVNIANRILFVDDEENVLRSLKRLFMSEDYEVLTALSGPDGLAVLKEVEVPVIVSDQRMPVMTGAEFLEKSRELSPDSVRIILTGYADVEAAIGAINRGGAYRYVSKPWNDNELLLVIKDAFDKYRLVKENKYLTELTIQQNDELKKWSTELEFYVQQHTIELTNQNKELKKLNAKLKNNVSEVLASLSGLIELRNRSMRNHSNNVALLSKSIAEEIGLTALEIETIAVGAQLHDIGKIGAPDIILIKNIDELSPDEMAEYVKHPIRGQAAIDGIEDFRGPGILVRHHHEWYNGKGFPDGLKGDKIPIGARIISIADRFDRTLQGEMRSIDTALVQIKSMLASQFDAALYAPLEKAARKLFSSIISNDIVEIELNTKNLFPGMVLSRDVSTGTGLLLLRKGSVLNDKNIETLKRAVYLDPSKSGIFVTTKKGTDMIEYDDQEKKMVLKLVYYGPAMSGKTTNLLSLHDLIEKKGRGDLMILDTADDRTIYFDFLPFLIACPSGLKIKIKLYTVPGQVKHDATRKAVLARADGVAFIADSRLAEMQNNAESFENLEKNLGFVGIDIGKIPLVIQFNKRDLKDIIPEEEVRETWGKTGLPVLMASALFGKGVTETFRALLERTYEAIDARIGLNANHGLTREFFLSRILSLSTSNPES